jgi:hypothetical protein
LAYLLLLDRLQNLDDALLVGHYVNALKHLAILSSANLSHNLIIVLAPVRHADPPSGSAALKQNR